MVNCTDCKWALLRDSGYFNYTVMGIDFTCMKGKHPEKEPFDIFYGEDKRLQVDCEYFTAGEPVDIDVDMEKPIDDYFSDAEQRAAYDAME